MLAQDRECLTCGYWSVSVSTVTETVRVETPAGIGCRPGGIVLEEPDGCSTDVLVPNRLLALSNCDVSQKPVSPSQVPTGACRTFLGQSSPVSAVFGYLRVSGTDQVLDLQRDALAAAGCSRCQSQKSAALHQYSTARGMFRAG